MIYRAPPTAQGQWVSAHDRRRDSIMNIPRTLHNKRKQLNMTQKEISDFLGVAETTYQKWEKGKNEPSPSMLEMISVKLKIPIQDFFGNGPEREKHYDR